MRFYTVGAFADRADPSVRGQVGWWPLNEGAGLGVSDLIGRSRGALTGGAKWSGNFSGSAVILDGTDDYINFGTTVPILLNNFTISMWVYHETTTFGYVRFFGQYGNTEVNGTGWSLIIDPSDNYMFVKNNVQLVTPGIACRLRTWDHVLWVMNADNTTKFYLNGTLRYSDSNTQALMGTGVDTTLAGCFYGLGGISQFWPGRVANIRLYNRVLTGHEALRLYSEPSAGILRSRSRTLRLPSSFRPRCVMY
jgi:hypothetical protein